MKLTLNQKYMFLQGAFWMLYCIAAGFVSLCLQSRGLDNRGIGIVTASFGIASALLQPLLGRVCDKYQSLTFQKMILILAVPFFLICVIAPFTGGTASGIFFTGMLLLLGNTIMPFINSALSSYQLHGDVINFGAARGIGSAMFALLAVLIGNLAAKYGTNIIFCCGALISFLFLIIVFRMPCFTEVKKVPDRVSDTSQKGFFHRYPAFLIMYAAFIFLFTSHNLIGTYLLQIIQSFQGSSKEFGIAIAIQALVEVPVLFLFSFLLKKTKPHTLMLVSAFGFGVKAVWYALAGSILTIYLVQFTQIISFALFASASVYYTIELINQEDQITGQALMTSVMAIGAVPGSLLGGWLLDSCGVKGLLFVNIFIAATGILLAVSSIFVYKRRLV